MSEVDSVRLSSNRYNEIDKEVCKLFKRISIKKFPIDCFDICKQMKIKVCSYSELDEKTKGMCKEWASIDGFHALIEISKGKYEYRIYYNDLMNDRRIRFTIMHEIGHIVLNHTEHSILAESEANHFAAYALAPPPLIHYMKVEDFMDLAVIFELSEEFSYNAMKRYNNWLKYGSRYYLEYEEQLIDLFEPYMLKAV